MIALEEELQQKRFKEETDRLLREMPEFGENCRSIARLYVTDAVWLRLGRVVTTSGHTFTMHSTHPQ